MNIKIIILSLYPSKAETKKDNFLLFDVFAFWAFLEIILKAFPFV
jgi:hypothetical protein